MIDLIAFALPRLSPLQRCLLVQAYGRLLVQVPLMILARLLLRPRR